jgi:ubiquitin carboxyl-terminal hydrolase 34
MPDNLIFHLKRFDFNLRTLQRSKINDYFSFPSKVDMRPYTIEHLSDPSEDQPEDIFELVGILVHSGTAESGHYYSYIRERPTSSESEVWVEFNDDIVSSWDPAQMESSCFGGPDYRPPFDNNGMVYDKTYSAYMLFYQRSSSLQREQEMLRDSGLSSPLRVSVKDELAQFIQRENVSLLRRHCLYDPWQIHFVELAVCHMKTIHKNQCSPGHEMENMAIRMALSHLDQVAARTKDVPDFESLLNRLGGLIETCSRCSFYVFEYFNQRNEALRMLVQRNPEPMVRLGTADMFIRALRVIRTNHPVEYGIGRSSEAADEDDDDGAHIIRGVIRIFKLLWEFFHMSVRSWHEVFGFMLSFVRLGADERAAFLDQPFLKNLIFIISADPNLDMPQQFVRMITTVSRRLATRPPSYETIISLLEALLSVMHMPVNDRGDLMLLDHVGQRLELNDTLEGPFLFTRNESRLLHQDWARGQANIFVEKLIGINQDNGSTDLIIDHLIRYSRTMEEKVARTLRIAISGQITTHHNTPYLEVAAHVFCRVATQPELINKLINHVSQQCMTLQNAEGRAFFDFQRDVFDGTRENSGESPEDVQIIGFENLPDWVPGLLGYFDSVISNDVEHFLYDSLFKWGPSPDLGDSAEDIRRSEAMTRSARLLGIKCLSYLRDNYVNRRVNVANHLVMGLERVIKECAKYFKLDEAAEDEMTAEFVKLSQSKSL